MQAERTATLPHDQSQQSRRRDLLGALAVLPLAVSSPTVAGEPQDPHLGWADEERRRWAAFNALPLNDPRYATIQEQDAADMEEFEAFEDLMVAVMTTPARTLGGVQEQVRYALYCNEEWHGDREELVTTALQNALATLASLTGRA